MFSCAREKENYDIDKSVNENIDDYLKNDFDSTFSETKINFLLEEVKSLKSDSVKTRMLNDLAKKFLDYDSINEFYKTSKILLKHCSDISDTLNIANSYKNFGTYFVKKNQNDSAFYYFNKAEAIFVSKNDLDNAAILKVKKAKIQYFRNDYLGCEASVLKVLRLFEVKKDYKYLNVCYTLIGLSKIETNETKEGIEYLNKALNFARSFEKDENMLFFENNNLGLAYIKKEDYKNALFFFKKTLNDKVKSLNLDIYLSAKQFITYCNFKLNLTRDFEKSYSEIITEAKENGLSYIIPTLQLSEYYYSINKYDKAQTKAVEAYNITLKDKLYRQKLLALKQLSDVFPDKAKFYSDEYVKLKDSIADVDKKTSNTFARIEYRVDELNSENFDLQRKNKNFIIYFIIFLLLVTLSYFINWRRTKMRELELIKAQNEANEKAYKLMINQHDKLVEVRIEEQKRISKEIHDAILGRLFGIRMNLDFLNQQNSNETSQKRKEYIHQLQEIENDLRTISHELNDEKRAILNNFKYMIDKLVSEQESINTSQTKYLIKNTIPWQKFDDLQKINIYRILQETFQNINKYANAKNIIFEVSFDDPNVVFNITDNGIGFNTSKKSKGIGIKNMKERAVTIGATLTITSTPGSGSQTTLSIKVA